MRVLQVIHDYLPLHTAGSEIYTARLARALADAGHDVEVFTCEENRALPQHSLTERVHDGIPVHEAIYNRIYHDLSEHWDDPAMGAVFAGVLDGFRPDLVHVQGLQFVGGVSSLRAVAERDVPLVMTLHEYWWLCPRSGLMYDLDGRPCERVDPVECARCMDAYPVDRQRWSDEACGRRHQELGDRRWFARALEAREVELRAASALVDRFIAPSGFLAGRYREWGVPDERLVVSDYGFPAVAPRPPRAPGRPLRAGFVGTLSDYKGVEVLGRAAERLSVGADALTVSVHGPLDWFPDVTARLTGIAERCDALELCGAFAPDSKSAIYDALDLLVVPSLWWENSPLTIHEAWQHGVPVVTSAMGGMAELASLGGAWTYPPGDELALAELLSGLAREPERVAAMAATIPPVRDVSEDVALLERLEHELRRSSTG